MPTTVAIACPDCNKQFKVPSDLEGKKVRCKECGCTFAVKLPKNSAAAPKSTAVKPAQTGGKAEEVGEYDEARPYEVTTLDLTPRCPHCAYELETRDAVLCINCGYNLATREHMSTVKTVENSGSDQFLWLLPGIICVVVVFLLIGLDIFWCVFLPDLVAGDDAFWWLASGPVSLWLVIMTLFTMFFCIRFAIRRLILNPVAPEVQKH